MDTVKMAWGLLEYKPQWSLTLKAWLLLFVAFLLILWGIISHIQGFLAMKAPTQADALVIEGWVGDAVIQGGIEEFNRGQYRWIITAGLPLYRGFFLSDYKNHAELTKATLIQLGVDPDRIIAIALPEVKKDRTAATAVAVKDWLANAGIQIQGLNVYSADVHTRRSYLIYKTVFKSDVRVGAIAHPNSSYDPRRWWTSSIGFRSVIEESIAYFYARFLWRIEV